MHGRSPHIRQLLRRRTRGDCGKVHLFPFAERETNKQKQRQNPRPSDPQGCRTRHHQDLSPSTSSHPQSVHAPSPSQNKSTFLPTPWPLGTIDCGSATSNSVTCIS